MQMTEEEIRRNYRQAKDKPIQIGILADLNCTDQNTIREILGLEKKNVRKAKTGKEDSKKTGSADASVRKTGNAGAKEATPGAEQPTIKKRGRKPKTVEVPGEVNPPKSSIPQSILDYAYSRMSTIEELIKEYEAEYKELAQFVLRG